MLQPQEHWYPLRLMFYLSVVVSAASVAAHLLSQFSVAWWIWVDAHVNREHLAKEGADPLPPPVLVYYYIPGIVSTLAIIMYAVLRARALNPSFFALFANNMHNAVRKRTILNSDIQDQHD